MREDAVERLAIIIESASYCIAMKDANMIDNESKNNVLDTCYKIKQICDSLIAQCKEEIEGVVND